MFALCRLWLGAIKRLISSRRNLLLENLTLRQQLAVQTPKQTSSIECSGPLVPSENSVLIESVDVIGCGPVGCSILMSALFLVLFSSLRSSLCSRAALQAEILALRHQLLVLTSGSNYNRRTL